MRITLSDAGKRFNREWIFRHFNHQFTADKKYAITGPNGSGKSTLLQSLAGALMLTEGTVAYAGAEPIAPEKIFTQISLAAPYLEPVEEMTGQEFFRFHQVFKPLLGGITVSELLEKVGLAGAADKQIRYYSSGMKQRVRLAQAFFSDTPVLLLDEPTTNLDAPGIALYQSLIETCTRDRLLIISSNEPAEYSFADEIVHLGSR